MVLPKRKAPVNLSLLDDDSADNNGSSTTEPESSFTESPCGRVCTPSPPLSPRKSSHEERPESILRQGPRKRRKLLHYRDTVELVDPVADWSIASTYEMNLLSHMVMNPGEQHPGFKCRMCSSSSFVCKSLACLDASLPLVEEHLRVCQQAPVWLPDAIDKSRITHDAERCPRKPYSRLVWKRLLAHSVYSKTEFRKRVRFSKRHETRIIPARVMPRQP